MQIANRITPILINKAISSDEPFINFRKPLNARKDMAVTRNRNDQGNENGFFSFIGSDFLY
jgi:hypothetical protein